MPSQPETTVVSQGPEAIGDVSEPTVRRFHPLTSAVGRVQPMARRAGGSAVYHLPAVGPGRPLNGRNGMVTGRSQALSGGRDPARSGRPPRAPPTAAQPSCGHHGPGIRPEARILSGRPVHPTCCRSTLHIPGRPLASPPTLNGPERTVNPSGSGRSAQTQLLQRAPDGAGTGVQRDAGLRPERPAVPEPEYEFDQRVTWQGQGTGSCKGTFEGATPGLPNVLVGPPRLLHARRGPLQAATLDSRSPGWSLGGFRGAAHPRGRPPCRLTAPAGRRQGPLQRLSFS